jgi:DNA (cytosine-5)-methyltransferase 1
VAISYNKLWKLLIDKGMNKTQLGIATGISTSTISKLGKNETINMESMMKICRVLDCDIGDIVEMVDDEEQPNK